MLEVHPCTLLALEECYVRARPEQHEDATYIPDKIKPMLDVYARVLSHDGRAVASFGVFPGRQASEGQVWAIITQEAVQEHPRGIARVARLLMNEARGKGFRQLTAYIRRDFHEAQRFAQWLGFVPCGTSEKKGIEFVIYQWEAA